MAAHMDMAQSADCQIWNVINACFFGLLRISAVTTPTTTHWEVAKILTRADIKFVANGYVLTIKHSKTNQFRDRQFEAVIPHLPNRSLCPMMAMTSFVRVAGSSLPVSAPALAYLQGGQVKVITPAMARQRLQQLFGAIGLQPRLYGTHSLRRSGASHLLAAGLPIETIKVIGDWRSDCVYRYLSPSGQSKLDMLQAKMS